MLSFLRQRAPRNIFLNISSCVSNYIEERSMLYQITNESTIMLKPSLLYPTPSTYPSNKLFREHLSSILSHSLKI